MLGTGRNSKVLSELTANPWTNPGESVKAKVSSNFSKNTEASYPWASERAHSLKYEAVFEIDPRTNSIVSMSWWMKISPKLWLSCFPNSSLKILSRSMSSPFLDTCCCFPSRLSSFYPVNLCWLCSSWCSSCGFIVNLRYSGFTKSINGIQIRKINTRTMDIVVWIDPSEVSDPMSHV